jgi:TolB-like protein
MAIQAFERCRAVLNELLDAQPSEETARILTEIRTSGTQPQGVGAPAAAEPRVRAESLAPVRPEPRTEPRPEPSVRETRAESSREPAYLRRGGARVGVMPLQLIGTSEAEAHLGTGLAEEITSALARFRWMFLVSSSSLLRFVTQTRDENAIRRAFDIHFLLDGTIQRIGMRLRIAMRLLDLRAGNQVVWSRRFDRDADDLLTLQDEIAAEAVAQIDPELLLIESQRVAARPLADSTAYDLVLRALALIDRLERPLFVQAGELLRQAIGLEPDFAAAHAWSAYWYMFLVGQGWAKDPALGMSEAGRLAERAITLDPQDAKALTIAGHVRAFLDRRLREAIALHERALSLNPNLAMAWNLSGVAFAYMGDHDEAMRRLNRYKKLSPLDPRAFFYDTAFIIVALLRRDYAEAASVGRSVSEMNPAFSAACKPYLAALGHFGLVEEAETVRRRLLAIEPEFTVRRFLQATPFERAEDREHYAEGLRKAGVAEG